MWEPTDPAPPPQPLPSPEPEVLAYARGPYPAAASEARWDRLPAFAGMALLTAVSSACMGEMILSEGGPPACCWDLMLVLLVPAAGTASVAATLAVLRAQGRWRAARGTGAFALVGFAYALAATGWLFAMAAADVTPFGVGTELVTACAPPFLLGAIAGLCLARKPAGEVGGLAGGSGG